MRVRQWTQTYKTNLFHLTDLTTYPVRTLQAPERTSIRTCAEKLLRAKRTCEPAYGRVQVRVREPVKNRERESEAKRDKEK